MEIITVGELFKGKHVGLDFRLVSGKGTLKREISSLEINRPVLGLLGYFELLQDGEIMVLGKAERFALDKLGRKERTKRYRELFRGKIPCIIITDNINFPKTMLEEAKKAKLPVLKTPFSTTRVINRVSTFLENNMTPKTTAQGVMMDVYGMGILIKGESGIGKSECALELLKRGHRLISDDLVGIKQRAGNILVAYSLGMQHHYIEVRGLGIVDIENVFGIGSVRNAIKVELVVKLEEWSKGREYDRLGIENKFAIIMGIKIPEVIVPVTAGRNLAVIVELAAKNQRLKDEGHYAAKELDEQLKKITRKKK